jgi:hypothetical protein
VSCSFILKAPFWGQKAGFKAQNETVFERFFSQFKCFLSRQRLGILILALSSRIKKISLDTDYTDYAVFLRRIFRNKNLGAQIVIAKTNINQKPRAPLNLLFLLFNWGEIRVIRLPR